MINLRCAIALAATLLLAGSAHVASAQADTLAKIINDGKLVAGVKTDFVPWGMRDAQGNIVGFEIDLIKDFARQVGEKAGKQIEVELVPVAASNRMQFLEQGRIDVMIATMSDTEERRKVVGIVTPSYYSSGVSIFARNDSGIDSWESINGKTLCSVQGAWYIKEYGLANGAEVVTFKGVPEIETTLLAGRCAGWLYDDSALISLKVLDPEKWADYSLVVPVMGDVPWGMAVRKEELQDPIAKALSEALVGWHKSGTIIELAKKWGMPETKWLTAMKEKCLANDPVCSADQPAVK